MERTRIVLDTNVFVAAGFNPESHAAAIVRAIERGHLALVWDRDTRRETEAVLRRIPRLSWERFAPLFTGAGEHAGAGAVAPESFRFIADPGDRKFAALSAASGSVLITNDAHLLAHRGRLGLRVMTPSEFVGRGSRGEGEDDDGRAAPPG